MRPKHGGMTKYVVDANVFIHGSSRNLPFEEIVTVPAVTAELESVEARNRFESQDVTIQEPSRSSVATVKDVGDELGVGLSETDTELVALAYEIDAVLVTDDYAMQNIAGRLDVETRTFLQDGIEDVKKWKTVCTNCGEDVDGERCSVCGAETKKVPT